MRKQIMGLPRPRWILVFVGAVLLSVAAIGVIFGGDTDQAAIREAVAGGLAAQQSAIARPDATGSKAMTQGEVASLKGEVHAALAKYFTGRQLGEFESVMAENVDAGADGLVIYRGGGVDALVFKSVVIDGDTAIVEATATVWAEIETVDADGKGSVTSRPEADEVFTFELVRRGGRWLISREEFTFAPGEVP